MNWLKRIQDLDARVQELEALKAELAANPLAPTKTAKQRNYLRPLSKDARELFLFTFQMMLDQQPKDSKRPIRAADLLAEIQRLDTDNVFPHGHHGEVNATMRAILAEEAGMFIQWSRQPMVPGPVHRKQLELEPPKKL